MAQAIRARLLKNAPAQSLDEAYATIERCDREAADLVERQVSNLVRVDHVSKREQFKRRRAARPPKPEPKLDTAPPDLDEKIAPLLDVIAELVAAGQRQDARIENLETLERELERRSAVAEMRPLDYDVVEKLGDDARKPKAEIGVLQNCIDELRGVVSAEAKRGSATVIDLPTRRYPRDLK